MANRTRSNQGRGRPAEGGGGDYAQWLMLVPKDKRKEVADFILDHTVETYDDLVGFGCKIMAALMEGRITPAIAKELRAWHEMNFTVIAAKNVTSDTPQETYSDIVTALVQVKRETKKLRGDYFNANELLDEREPVMVEVKSGQK
tara:strand:- start:1444 stop:1878 length:435 start_codon:yes stop_codon:yes gene_type:complete